VPLAYLSLRERIPMGRIISARFGRMKHGVAVIFPLVLEPWFDNKVIVRQRAPGRDLQAPRGESGGVAGQTTLWAEREATMERSVGGK
jgi:hypothetical protein